MAFDVNALVAETVGSDSTVNVTVADSTSSEAKSKSGN